MLSCGMTVSTVATPGWRQLPDASQWQFPASRKHAEQPAALCNAPPEDHEVVLADELQVLDGGAAKDVLNLIDVLAELKVPKEVEEFRVGRRKPPLELGALWRLRSLR